MKKRVGSVVVRKMLEHVQSLPLVTSVVVGKGLKNVQSLPRVGSVVVGKMFENGVVVSSPPPTTCEST